MGSRAKELRHVDFRHRSRGLENCADTLVSPESQRALAESIGATIVEIGTDHSAFGEQPEDLPHSSSGQRCQCDQRRAT